LDQPGSYEVVAAAEPVNETVQQAVPTMHDRQALALSRAAFNKKVVLAGSRSWSFPPP
jgi:hypothetical protein